MGTRHLICVVHEKKMKVANYGQWDGYPTGQGASVLKFLKEKFDQETFINGLSKMTVPTQQQMEEWWKEAGADPKDNWVTQEVCERFYNERPELSRDMGAGILEVIQSGRPWLHRPQEDFGNDSLFCEYAYVLDLDCNELHCYRGFQKTAPAPEGWWQSGPKDGYYPITLVAKFPFNALPEDSDFILAIDGEDENEE